MTNAETIQDSGDNWFGVGGMKISGMCPVYYHSSLIHFILKWLRPLSKHKWIILLQMLISRQQLHIWNNIFCHNTFVFVEVKLDESPNAEIEHNRYININFFFHDLVVIIYEAQKLTDN